MYSSTSFQSEIDEMMMFGHCNPLDVSPFHHNMHAPLPGSHGLHPISIKPPSLIHADDDAYASLPPTPTSPFDLAAPGSSWHHQQPSPLSQQPLGCNRGMYGGLSGDVAIAGQGQYMNVSFPYCDKCDDDQRADPYPL